MSEEKAAPPQAAEPTAAPPAPEPAPAKGKDRGRQVAIALVAIAAVLFVYHLFADRLTPYSPYGYIRTYLVAVAPQGWPVFRCWVICSSPKATVQSEPS